MVGAALAGMRCAEALRESGFVGELVLVGEEPHVPYTRPPLSKQILAGTWESERVGLRSNEETTQLDIELRLGLRAEFADTQRKIIGLSDGSELSFDGLVIATGARARELPQFAGRPGVRTLRTLDDALELKDAVADADSVVVVGGGFIGAEVAATCAEAGKQVAIIESQETMLIRGLGALLGGVVEQLHRDHGVDVYSGRAISKVTDDGTTTTIALEDGTSLSGDVVVLGVGALPNTEWLQTANVKIEDGIACDEFCRVLNSDGEPLLGVAAAGDVARWRVESQGAQVRIEHWTNAQEQAKAAAATVLFDLGLTSEPLVPYDPTPYVWSDQFGKKIQVVGYVRGTDTPHVVKGNLDGSPFLALMEREGELVGAVSMAMVPALVKARMLIDASASLTEAQEAFIE
mgnify:CR=1 FL=1